MYFDQQPAPPALATSKPAAEQPPALTPRELATVLAALRSYQAVHCNPTVYDNFTADIRDVATDGGTLTPLTVEEIESLCERLNCTSLIDRCAICRKQSDPNDDGRNEQDEHIGEHWVCETCATNNSPEEIAEHLGIDPAAVYEAMGLEQPKE